MISPPPTPAWRLSRQQRLQPRPLFLSQVMTIVHRNDLPHPTQKIHRTRLGKTAQALAAIAHVVSADSDQHHIVICPATLIDNWLREINETIPILVGWAFRDRDHGRQAALDGLAHQRWNPTKFPITRVNISLAPTCRR